MPRLPKCQVCFGLSQPNVVHVTSKNLYKFCFFASNFPSRTPTGIGNSRETFVWSLSGTSYWGIKEWKFIVIFIGFALNGVLFGLVLYIDPCHSPAIVEGSFADSSLFFRRSCDYEIHKLEQAGGVLEMFKNGPYCRNFLNVSENRGFSPQIIHFNRVFHYKPSILGVFPLFLETPFSWGDVRWSKRTGGEDHFLAQPPWLCQSFFFFKLQRSKETKSAGLGGDMWCCLFKRSMYIYLYLISLCKYIHIHIHCLKFF